MPELLQIRRFEPGDEPALYRVFHSAIHQIAARDYSPEQLVAWAPAGIDPELWAKRMRGMRPFVATAGAELVGYADLQPTGYIDHFFVGGSRPRQGIGTLLMRRLHAEAHALGLGELSSDVSLTAQPFFAQHGFRIIEQRSPVLRGVVIPNTRMRKVLGDQA